MQCKSKSVSTRGVDPYTSECVGPDSVGVHDTYNQVKINLIVNLIIRRKSLYSTNFRFLCIKP